MRDRLRPSIAAMAGYTPGEQPRDNEFLKLNTNESPYPPSPKVFEAIREALTDERLRKYPDPTGSAFRITAGRVLGVDPDGIVIGNGSDDILTILTRAFVPEGGLIVSPTPSYLLYRTLAELQGARYRAVSYHRGLVATFSLARAGCGHRVPVEPQLAIGDVRPLRGNSPARRRNPRPPCRRRGLCRLCR